MFTANQELLEKIWKISVINPDALQANLFYNNKAVTLNLHKEFDYIKAFILGTENFYEIELLEYIYKNYPNHKTIVDIGANIGNHLRFFEEFLSFERIHAFEPQIKNYELLKRNSISNKTFCHNLALGSENKFIDLENIIPNNCGTFRVKESQGNTRMITLDTLGLTDVTMIKMDVEGYDISVLKGAENTISKFKPVIFAEIENEGMEFLKKFGYKMKNVFEYDTIKTFELVVE